MYKIAEIVKLPTSGDPNTVINIYKHFETIKGYCSNYCAHLEDLATLGYEIIGVLDNRLLILKRSLVIKSDTVRVY